MKDAVHAKLKRNPVPRAHRPFACRHDNSKLGHARNEENRHISMACDAPGNIARGVLRVENEQVTD